MAATGVQQKHVGGVGSGDVGDGFVYDLEHMRHSPEDIVFCLDVDSEAEGDMKSSGSKNAQVSTRLSAIKQAVILFMYSKLDIDRRHRFAIATLADRASWHLRPFTSDVDYVVRAMRDISATRCYDRCDLYSLFRLVYDERQHSMNAGHYLRLILIYCRSAVVPDMEGSWSRGSRHFMCDAIYLHDKPKPNNRPQQVFDALVEKIELVSNSDTAYIFESSNGLPRTLFKHMCLLLTHPLQRCVQEDLDTPRDLAKWDPTKGYCNSGAGSSGRVVVTNLGGGGNGRGGTSDGGAAPGNGIGGATHAGHGMVVVLGPSRTQQGADDDSSPGYGHGAATT
ncbi:hypothetical protein CBR_g6395 [Chara braunii]|uniref:BRISC and BRCA1-A complex member 1 n=1 Tax=Chara braunii TaxID=69332 RepID=A0A388KJR4_CHABU|nr:hypothetical protein CBR_g6395 [Chara braunii]|eukprot:GBG70266.1 hypothetical protein CBR_g6395 [Chara braunii]